MAEIPDAAVLVTVRYFAAAAEAAGCEQEVLTFPASSTLIELRELLVDRYGTSMAHVLANGSFLVDRVVTRDFARPLGSAVDVLPPFAGG